VTVRLLHLIFIRLAEWMEDAAGTLAGVEGR
jgi:hypothetical protein